MDRIRPNGAADTLITSLVFSILSGVPDAIDSSRRRGPAERARASPDLCRRRDAARYPEAAFPAPAGEPAPGDRGAYTC
jgi:hypothetical protein